MAKLPKREAILLQIEADRRQRWGDISFITVAKYLEGTATPAETREVEAAIENHPSLRETVTKLRSKTC